MNIFLSTIATVISGTIVFIIGQIIVECFVKPMQEYKKIKSEISYLLVMHANKFHNPLNSKHTDEMYDDASEEMRSVAARLEGFKQIKPFFVRKDNVEKAKSGLIGISNSFYYVSDSHDIIKDNIKFQSEIKEALNIK